MAKWYEAVTGSLEEKKRYRQLKARMEAIPALTAPSPRRCTAIFCTTGASRTAPQPSR